MNAFVDAPPPRVRRYLLLAAVGTSLAFAVIALTLGPTLSNDEYFSLTYADCITDSWSFPDTPERLRKPLAILVAIGVNMAAPEALDDVRGAYMYELLTILCAGILVWGCGRMAWRLNGHMAAIIAIALLISNVELLLYTLQGSSVVWAGAGIFSAIFLIENAPRVTRGRLAAVCGLITGIGLYRPETWGLGILPLVWLVTQARNDSAQSSLPRDGILALGILALGPGVWAAQDYLISGSPLASMRVGKIDSLRATAGMDLTLTPSFFTGLGLRQLSDTIGFPVIVLAVATVLVEARRRVAFLAHPLVLAPVILLLELLVLSMLTFYPIHRYFVIPGWLLIPLAAAMTARLISALRAPDRSAAMKTAIAVTLLVTAGFIGRVWWLKADTTIARITVEATRQKATREFTKFLATHPDFRGAEDVLIVPDRRDEHIRYLLRRGNAPPPQFYTPRQMHLDNLDAGAIHARWIFHLPGDYPNVVVDEFMHALTSLTLGVTPPGRSVRLGAPWNNVYAQYIRRFGDAAFAYRVTPSHRTSSTTGDAHADDL